MIKKIPELDLNGDYLKVKKNVLERLEAIRYYLDKPEITNDERAYLHLNGWTQELAEKRARILEEMLKNVHHITGDHACCPI